VLDTVRVERDETGPVAVATDGRRLLAVRWQDNDRAEYPLGLGDYSPVTGFATMIPRQDWESLGKLPPKKTPKPILAHAVLCETGANGTLSAGATDLETVRSLSIRVPDGLYPRWRDFIADRRPHEWASIRVDAALLGSSLTAMAALTNAAGNHPVTVRVPLDPSLPIQIESDNADERLTAAAVIMPLAGEERADREAQDGALNLATEHFAEQVAKTALAILSPAQRQYMFDTFCRAEEAAATV